MPIYEYTCRDCGHDFEELVFGAETVPCPRCAHEGTEKRLSAFAVGSDAPQPVPAPGSCGTCGDPRGPGSCAQPGS